MAEIKSIEPEKLVAGFIYKEEEAYREAAKLVAGQYGEADFESEPMNFTVTGYYNEEIGSPLFKRFVSYKQLIMPDKLAEAKVFTNSIEDRLRGSYGKRRVNIDPGLLTMGKFILATAKNHQHRIYIGSGIWAEVALRYKEGGFTGWEWTYRDYLSPEYLLCFEKIREIYRLQIQPRGCPK